MRINHNISAQNTHRQYTVNNNNQSKSLEKLSSGQRINRAADDAAGLAISEKMRGQIRGLEQAERNAQDGISMIQTAEGALNETHSILQRMRELSVQSANDTNTADDRAEIQKEIDQLTSEIDRIANDTEFNSKKLLNGGASVSASVADGDANGESDFITIVGGTADTKAGTSIGIATSTLATAATTAGNVDVSGGALTADSSVTVNGVSFSFTSGQTTQEVLDTINNSDIGITASVDSGTGFLTFTSNEVGSSSAIDIGAATGNFSTMADDSGTDASITLGNTPNFTTYTARGNTITIEDGSAKGLSFELSGVLTDTAGDGTDDTTITVDSNGGLNFQIGANADQSVYVSMSDMRASALGVESLDVTSAAGAESAITAIDDAIKSVSSERSKLGAYQNRLDHTINNLGTSAENLTAAESRIRDVDMAKEYSEYTKHNILSQASTSMLAQANQQTQGVLQLLR